MTAVGSSAGSAFRQYPPIFSHVVFRLIKSKELPQIRIAELKDALLKHGAIEYHAKDSVSAPRPTHIITATIDFEGRNDTENRIVSVVTPRWVEQCVVKRKLANTRSYSPDQRLFFSGLVVHIADLSEGDKDAIIGGIMAMGGLYSSSLSKLVTHVVAPDAGSQACQMALSSSMKCEVVLPSWFSDCLRFGRRISERPYRLADSKLLIPNSHEQLDKASHVNLKSDLAHLSNSSAMSVVLPGEDHEQLQVFLGKTLLLSNDLGIAPHLRQMLEERVKASKGLVALTIDDADIVVCRYREDDDFHSAITSGKTVGSLAWLYHVITRDEWTSPSQQLLHYPAARNGIPGFGQYRISISNYSGEARIYLENLARAAGCEFTKTMKTDNTHLITAHPESEKCDAAREWNIHIVNHLWLEESYSKCEIQSVANSRYSFLPPRTNLGDVGLTPIDEFALKNIMCPSESKKRTLDESNGDHQMHESETPSNGKFKILKQSFPASSKETLLSNKPGSQQLGQQSSDISKPQRSAPRVTPAWSPLSGEGKENKTPLTTGSRGAKEQAVTRIHRLAPDIALYEKEKKRVGGGFIFGGRPKEGELVQQATKPKLSSPVERQDGSEDRPEHPLPKRPKTYKTPTLMRLLVTGYDKWTSDEKLFLRAKATFHGLGIMLTREPSNCTHLAAPRILRTPKFICAMSQAPTLLHVSFIEDCLKGNKVPTIQNYALHDTDGENRYGLRLAEAIRRAKANAGALLRDQRIFVTEDIKGGPETYRAVIEANGGQYHLLRPRLVSAASIKQDGPIGSLENGQFLYLISGEASGQVNLWPRFRELAESLGRTARIVKADWLLDMALSQRVQESKRYEVSMGV